MYKFRSKLNHAFYCGLLDCIWGNQPLRVHWNKILRIILKISDLWLARLGAIQ